MHLAKLSLDLGVSQVRRDISNLYDMHRTLSRAFLQGDEQSPTKFLWRMEPGLSGCQPMLLVQSEQAGNWGHVREALGDGVRVETKAFDLGHLCKDGGHFRFRLVANPTVTRCGKRHGLVTEAAQLKWLQRQGARAGFDIEVALVNGSETQRGRKGGMRISLQRACFDGVLRITDVGGVLEAVRRGIGPGKAFGCGLLSLAPC